MRERFLNEFDLLWFDSLNGDSRRTGKLTPEGKPDPSVFSTEYNKEGIRVGTAIGLMVRKAQQNAEPIVRFRQFWGVSKRQDLLKTAASQSLNTQYQLIRPTEGNRFSFDLSAASEAYTSWPSVKELAGQHPNPGFLEARRGALIDIDKTALEKRMRMFYDPEVSWDVLDALKSSLTEDFSDYKGRIVRPKVQAEEAYESNRLRRYTVRPFDKQWCYLSNVRPLWNSSRPELYAQCWAGNGFLVTRLKTEKETKGSPFYFSFSLVDYQTIARNVSVVPLRLRLRETANEPTRQSGLFKSREEVAENANLSSAARAYLASLGISDPDADAETAGLVWMHALAIGYSPAYLAENADGIRGD